MEAEAEPSLLGRTALVLALACAWLAVAGAARGEEGDGFFATPSLYWKHGDHRIDVGASVRFRPEIWDAFNTDLGWYGGTRERIRVQYGFREKFFLAGEFQAVQLFGMELDGTGALALYRNANGVGNDAHGEDLRSLYVEGRFVPGSFLRVGRQDIKLGQEVLYQEPNWRYLKMARMGERLVGTVGWSHVERAYDGGAGAFELGGVQLYGFAAQPTTGVFDAEEAYSNLRDITLGGATLTIKRGTLCENSEFGFFGLGYHDDRPVHHGGLPDDLTIGTLGAHWLGVYPFGPGNVDVLLWGAGQFGEYNGLDHGAGAGIAEVGYQLTNVWAKPWLRLGVNVASGDADPGDGFHRTFFNMLPTNHLYYGFADQLAFQNLVNPFIQLRAAPHPMLAFNVFFHWFELMNQDDMRYAGTGAYNKSAFGFPATPSGGHHTVGTELDLVATITPHRTTTIEVGYSWLNGGPMFRTAPGRDVQFFYASLEFKY
jgi:hypothetical protein